MVKKYITSFCLLLSVSLLYGQAGDNDNTMILIVEESPFFNGDLKKFIQKEIDYPLSARRDSIEGTVIISFWIDTLGFTFGHKVIRGVREDLNNEALRVTKLINFERPALQKGRPLEVRCIVPVEFKLKYVSPRSPQIVRRRDISMVSIITRGTIIQGRHRIDFLHIKWNNHENLS